MTTKIPNNKLETTLSLLKDLHNTSEFNSVKLSDGTEYMFKSITVREQKIFSKLLINSNQDFLDDYEIILGMIKYLSLNPNFNINNLTDIDKFKILTKILSTNYNIVAKLLSLSVKCEKCNNDNQIEIQINEFLKLLENIEEENKKEFESELKIEKIINDKKIVLEYSFIKVMRLIEIIKFLRKARININDKEVERYITESLAVNLELFNSLFDNINETIEDIDTITKTKNNEDNSQNKDIIDNEIKVKTEKEVEVRIDEKIKQKILKVKNQEDDINKTFAQNILQKVSNKLKVLLSLISDNLYINVLMLDTIKIYDSKTNEELSVLNLSEIDDIIKTIEIVESLPVELFNDDIYEKLIKTATRLLNLTVKRKCSYCDAELPITPPLYLFFI